MLAWEREARLLFLSFLRLRVVSGGFGRDIALLARPQHFATSYPLKIIYISMILVSSGSFWMAKKLPKPYAQNTPKIIKKCNSPPKKSFPKPPKIEPKAVQNRGLEGIPLEIVFPSQTEPLIFHSWGRLRAFWARLGAVLGVLGRLGRVLGPS